MKFLPARRRNPFDNMFLAVTLHVVAIGGTFFALYVTLILGTLVPIGVALGVLAILEAVWLYYRLRR